MEDEKKAVIESKKKKLNCCGKSYNVVHPELSQYIFVEDDFLIKKTVQWIQAHIEDYHAIGEHAKKALQNLQNTDTETSGQAAALKALQDFFSFYFNNPFAFENGIKMDDEEYLFSELLDCYFLKLKKGLCMPIGCLRDFMQGDMEFLIEEFLAGTKNSLRKYTELVDSTSRQLQIKRREFSFGNAATLRRAVAGCFIAVISVCMIIYTVLKADIGNLNAYLSGTETPFQAAGFLFEEGFKINHNSFSARVLVILLIVWLVNAIIINRQCVFELRNGQRREALLKGFRLSDNLRTWGADICKESESQYKFVKENFFSEKKIYLSREKWDHGNKQHIHAVLAEGLSISETEIGRKLPRNWILAVLTGLTVLSIIFFVGIQTENGRAFFDEKVKQAEQSFHAAGLKQIEYYQTKKAVNLRAANDKDALILCKVSENTKVQITQKLEDADRYKVKVLTKYGYVSGWIYKDYLQRYDPMQDGEALRAKIIDASASSHLNPTKTYGPKKVYDHKISTCWEEAEIGDGIGEWIRIDLKKAGDIAAIGIFNGNGKSKKSYYQNGRVTRLNVIFLYEDEEVGKEQCVLADGYRRMQYITFNKTVLADAIQLEIEEVASGSKYEDTCIAEISVYKTKLNS